MHESTGPPSPYPCARMGRSVGMPVPSMTIASSPKGSSAAWAPEELARWGKAVRGAGVRVN